VRAERLFRHLIEIDTPNSAWNQALLGQFHLLRALSGDPEDVASSASRLANPETDLAMRLVRWGVSVDEPGQEVDRPVLAEARHWLQKAMQEGEDHA
jgi:hypothetical protein